MQRVGNTWDNTLPFHVQKQKMPPPGIAPGLPAPQAGVLLLYYSGGWRIRVSIPVLNLAKVVCYHVQQSPMCVHRDSNPNLILGRDKYYPCTMDAQHLPPASLGVGVWDVQTLKKKKNGTRHQPDSNRRGHSPLDFESNALTTRP